MKLYLFIALLLLSTHSYAETTSQQENRENFKEKQGIISTKDQDNEELITIKASLPLTSVKSEPDIKSELQLKTRKILHWFYSEKPELKDKDFALETQQLTPKDYWQEDNTANLISQVKANNIVIVEAEPSTIIQENEEDTIKNIAVQYLLQNTVELLNIYEKKFITSLSSKEKATQTTQEKITAYQVLTKKSQALLTGFIHGEKISTNETLKTISIKKTSNNQEPVRHDITSFDETLKSAASGALSTNKTQCWDDDNTYYCISYINVNH